MARTGRTGPPSDGTDDDGGRPGMSGPEFFLYLPQMRMDMDAITERALVAEAAGFCGVAFMDHLAPPLMERAPMFEAMTVAAWVAARTTELRVGHLVLCDSFRHPAVLARQCVTLDHASGGRFELGLGSGSMSEELVDFGVTNDRSGARIGRLAETLQLLEAFWSGEPVVHEGRHFQVDCPGEQPVPLERIPIVIGGSSGPTLELVGRHADWWNLPVHHLDRLEACRPLVGRAKVSTQHLVAFVPDASVREDVTDTARRRFGGMASELLIGDADQLVAGFAEYRRRGVERCYVWFSDFARLDTVRAFGDRVIGAFGG